MRNLISIAVAMVFAICTHPALASHHGGVADAIRAQEEAWAVSLLSGDLESVGALMHRDFRLVRAYSDEPPISKPAYLGADGISATAVNVTSVSIVEMAGPIVVARSTWSMDWEMEGAGKLPPHFDMIDTWVEGDDGVWRILSRVSQLADDPPPKD